MMVNRENGYGVINIDIYSSYVRTVLKWCKLLRPHCM